MAKMELRLIFVLGGESIGYACDNGMSTHGMGLLSQQNSSCS